FAQVAKNLGDGTPLASLDAVVQIFKDPVQPLPKGPAYTAFARAHESHQENRTGFHWRRFRPQTRTSFSANLPAGTRLQTFSFCCYFAVRFLRWILPLKLRSTTVDDTAARPMVPTKALPFCTKNDVCDLGWRGMSSCTSPFTERAVTSAEVF